MVVGVIRFCYSGPAFESALEGFAREYRLLISFYRERFKRKVSAEGKKGEEMGDVRCGMYDH